MLETSSQQREAGPGRRIEEEEDDDDADSLNSRAEEVPPSSTIEGDSSSSLGNFTMDNLKDTAQDDQNNEKNGGAAMDSVREYDVLMGRGSGPNRHSGNIHFRAIVGEVFDEFLSKNGSDRTMNVDNGAEMVRIDPSTKNRLAQAVLDKITLEKKGRFLQKLNKKEILDIKTKGKEPKLIKARALNIMDAVMSTATTSDNEKLSGGEQTDPMAPAVVYYKIIPEKQILAKIKQTFRFLRDQNEQSNAEKNRLREAAAIAGCGVVPRDPQSISTNSFGAIGSMHLPGGLANRNAMAAYALMGRMSANGRNMNHPRTTIGINPSPLPDSPSFSDKNSSINSANTNSGVKTSVNDRLWAATRNLGNIVVPTNPSPMATLNAIKPFNGTNPTKGEMDLSTVASRLLCDLPQPKRIISAPAESAAAIPSIFQRSSLAVALDSSRNSNNIASSVDNPTKRLIEELTLTRLVNLQKQREDTINAYLAMERSSSATPGLLGVGNAVSSIDSVGVTHCAVASQQQQLQRLLN